ncbi:hypothetical protein CLAIMM_04938 [Cladophialophora immunda]|nr:hypothetical protein CLAIMM_04938 [Cladophialophora immunda]
MKKRHKWSPNTFVAVTINLPGSKHTFPALSRVKVSERYIMPAQTPHHISPELLSNILFGVVMFFIALYALWQTHRANRQHPEAVIHLRRQQTDALDQV